MLSVIKMHTFGFNKNKVADYLVSDLHEFDVQKKHGQDIAHDSNNTTDMFKKNLKKKCFGYLKINH